MAALWVPFWRLRQWLKERAPEIEEEGRRNRREKVERGRDTKRTERKMNSENRAREKGGLPNPTLLMIQ